MKKFFRTKFMVTVVSPYKPVSAIDVGNITNDIEDNSNDLVASFGNLSIARISSRAAAAFFEKHTTTDDTIEDRFGIDEEGNELDEEE